MRVVGCMYSRSKLPLISSTCSLSFSLYSPFIELVRSPHEQGFTQYALQFLFEYQSQPAPHTPTGYQHHASWQDLVSSALAHCKLCEQIASAYGAQSINLPNPPRHNLNNMPLPILHINTPPTQFPLHRPQNLYSLLLKVLLPLPQLLYSITRERDMLS